MKKSQNGLTDAEILRHKAEEKQKAQQPKVKNIFSEADNIKLIHELEVHQIELEMQHEELEVAKANAEITAAKYTTLYNFAPSGYISLSKEGTVLQLNLRAATILGKERIHLIDRRLGQFISLETRPAFNAFINKSFEQQGKQTCEAVVEIEGRPAQYIYFEGTHTKSGEECMLTMIDITERKQSELALQMSKDFLENIINAVASPIFVKDQSLKFCVVNDALCSLLNKSKNELIGKTGHEYFPDDQNEVFFRVDNEVLTTGRENINEEYLTDGEGVVRTIVTRKTFYADSLGNKFLVGIISDISELKNANKEIRSLNLGLEDRVRKRTNELEQANKELESFSYSISHDLQSPLRHISSFTDLLIGDYNEILPDEARHFLSTIKRNAVQMSVLIDALLDFARNNRKELMKTKLDMNKVVQAAWLQVKPKEKDRIIDWQVANLPKVNGDYSLLFLAWLNLIGNAVKYSKNREKAVIKVACQETDTEFIFSISDNGIGFDMKYAQKLYGVFQRMDTSKGFDGAGIGLANVHNIITRHGGKCWAEAEPDKGATFYISLPR
ncbi:MAG: ATP-binding protein [Bacteroidota bacterium]